jgi:8-oxo-dGTP pyrophosphatase MutT (NUDIX family)
MAAIASILRDSPKPFVGDKSAITRVRCVLMHREQFLLARHNSRRPENLDKWGLPGGRLKDREKPKACLRRELIEELGCRVPYLVKLGDWRLDDEQQRVFGCVIEQRITTFDEDELRAIDWFSYRDVIGLAAAGKLRTGFELAAILEFRRWRASVRGSERRGSV